MTTTSSIGSTTGTTASGNSVLSTSQAAYTDNTFLKLLTAQLQNQTPLEPVDNESFMNQMATYSSMQEQKDLNSNMLKLLDYQGVIARAQGLSQGSSLLGKEVQYSGDDGKAASGVVQSIYVAESGDVQLKLTDGKEVPLRSVLGITQVGESSTGTATATA